MIQKPPAELKAQVAFLISREIPSTDWRVTNPKWADGMLSSLSLRGPFGIIHVHNVYRNNYSAEKKLDMVRLVQECCSGDSDLLLGDFNLHHRLWAGLDLPPSKVCSDAKLLAEKTEELGMKLITDRGAITYTRSDETKSTIRSTLDLAFISRQLCPRLINWEVLNVSGFGSDHRICQTRLRTIPNRRLGARFQWDKTNISQLRQMVEMGLDAIGPVDLTTSDDIDMYVQKITQCLTDAIDHLVPKRYPSMLTPPHKSQSQQEPKSFRQVISSADGHQAAFRWSKVAQLMAKPADLPYCPDFQYNGKCAKDGLEKSIMYMDAIYGPGNTSQTSPINPDLPENLDCSVPSECMLNETNIKYLIKDLPNRKSSGVDIIGNEALKMVADHVAPHLVTLFNTCMDKGYCPTHFKRSKTILFLKPGKKADNPKAYRPIALLSSIGKIFEKIMVKHIKAFVAKAALNNKPLLPRNQFGGLAGRSTTMALQALTNFVYTGWASSNKRKVSLLGLDISGAFPRVSRRKLLRTLVHKGLPGYIIKFLWSFLCDRQTVLELPGHFPVDFYENDGLPQGSSLSPILFLFFAAPLLDNQKVSSLSGPTTMTFAFVDDTYIMVRSNSWEKNCRKIAQVHHVLNSWAEEHGISFAPEKYGLLHFLPPNTKSGSVKCVPNIDKLPPAEKLFEKEYLDILGVRVDNRLSWKFHVDSIFDKVARHRRYLRCISGSTWGLNLFKMRQLYVCKLLPIIAYGCGAWFFDYQGTIRQGHILQHLVKKLDTLQGELLVQISGAMKNTSRILLRKELHIYPLSQTLRIKAIAFHTCVYDTEHAKELRLTRERAGLGAQRLKAHPFTQLDILAEKLKNMAKIQQQRRYGGYVIEGAWNGDPDSARGRRNYIKQTTQDMLNFQASAEWDRYRNSRVPSSPESKTLALREPWAKRSLNYYKHLSRRQGTMLLHCRTGWIGLRSHLKRLNLEDSDRCPHCNKGPHCVEHLFIHCKHKSLALPRIRLFREAGTRNLNTIITRHARLAANFAITNFGIEQFSPNRSWKTAVKRPCTESEPLPPQKRQRTLAPGRTLTIQKA